MQFLEFGGRSWYVRPSGGSYGAENGTSYADAWDGFANIVWASIQPGDTLWVAGSHTQLLTIGASGISTKYIYIKSLIADPATISGSGSRTMCIDATSRTYLEFDGLTVTNSTVSNIHLQNGTYVLRNITSTSATGVGAQGFQNETGTIATYYDCNSSLNTDDGLSLHVNANVTAYRCNFFSNAQGVNGISTSVFTAYDCHFYSNTSSDLQPDSDATFIVYRCLFESTVGPNANSTVQLKVYNSVISNSLAQSAVLGNLLLEDCLILGTGGVTSNNAVTMNRVLTKSTRNNTISTSGAGSIVMNYCITNAQAAVNIHRHTSTGTFVLNNVTAKCINSTSGTGMSCAAVGLTANNCIFTVMQNAISSGGNACTLNNCNINFNVTLPTFGANITQNSAVTGDPKLNSPATDDYSLQSGSVGIDAGTNTGLATGISSAVWGTVATTPVVTTRVQGATYDLGAYIYN